MMTKDTIKILAAAAGNLRGQYLHAREKAERAFLNGDAELGASWLLKSVQYQQAADRVEAEITQATERRQAMKVGDKVKYAQDDDDTIYIYIIVELNGDHGFMQPLNWKYGFAPTILFRVAEVVAA